MSDPSLSHNARGGLDTRTANCVAEAFAREEAFWKPGAPQQLEGGAVE
jgi:hypothetical protein